MSDDLRCPVCGKGTLRHLGTESDERMQDAASAIKETYTCGHEVAEPSLATADAERLEVERRASDETVDPVDPV